MVKVVNCYGPYSNRKEFWKQIMGDGSLFDPSNIIGGDFSLTLSEREIWGSKIRVDPLATYLRYLLDKNRLVDVGPLPFLPTWSNGRERDYSIGKRFNRLWVVENMITSAKKFRSWIESNNISNHSPICLHLNFEDKQGNYRFKFNHSWIGELDFNELFHKFWNHDDSSSQSFPMVQLMDTLRNLKMEVCKWENQKKQLLQVELQKIESDIGFLFQKRLISKFIQGRDL